MNENFLFLEINTNDTWIRDFGPISVEIEDKTVWFDYSFNGWGLKFPAFLDNLATAQIADCLDKEAPKKMNIVLEGGSIECDGKGTLLTTSHCLLSPNRNPAYTKASLEEKLKRDFSLEKVLWLDSGALIGDDTDSHIDTLARFCDENTICYVSCDDEEDEHYPYLLEMKQALEAFRTSQNRPYKLVALPLPNAQYDPDDGHRLPATYANFLCINGAVLVPTYNDKHDNEVLMIFRSLFKDRKVIGIDCCALIRQHGSLHCSAMQI
jgi:agmatine deiminase